MAPPPSASWRASSHCSKAAHFPSPQHVHRRRATRDCARWASPAPRWRRSRIWPPRRSLAWCPAAAELKLLSDWQIIERLTQVRGIGRWTVEMMLMFQLRAAGCPAGGRLRRAQRLSARLWAQGHAQAARRWRSLASAGNPIAASPPGICGARWICPNGIFYRSASVHRESSCKPCRRRPAASKPTVRPARKRDRRRALHLASAHESPTKCRADAMLLALVLFATNACLGLKAEAPLTSAPAAGTLQSGRHAIVVAANPLAAKAGLDILRAGGSAGRCRGRHPGGAGPGGAAKLRPRRGRLHQLLRCAQP